MTAEQKTDVKAAIAFYEERGKDWGDVVSFLCLKYEGRLENYLNPHRSKMPHEYVKHHPGPRKKQ